jgi:phage shock protein PspC (stress-responsive transcriptional regulator)
MRAILEWSASPIAESERNPMNSVHESMTRQGLVRPRNGRIIGGVCAGLARRFGLDPWIARLIFVATLLIIPGSQILIYPVLWVLMPTEQPAYAPGYPPVA